MTIGPLLAVIPARAGSKGLPGKNVRPLAGLPLLVHSLLCARLCPQIDRCVVSTDGESIAEVARAYGADVPFMRPAELARDDTPMMPVLAHALDEVERLEGRRYGGVLLLDPTSPGRLPEDVAAAVEILEGDSAATGVIACSRPTFNPFWVGVIQKDGYLEPAFPQASTYVRRQDVPQFMRINGALYLWQSDFVRRAKSWTEGRSRFVEIPEARAFSIDGTYEFDLLELLLGNGLLRFPWLEGL